MGGSCHDPDEVVHVAIGQRGEHGSGSGGTFVIREYSDGSFEPIVIAGGAGGYDAEATDYDGETKEWCDGICNCANAQLNQYGNGCTKAGEINTNIGGDGVCNGGAGYKTDPPNTKENDPKSFQGGLEGGYHRQ